MTRTPPPRPRQAELNAAVAPHAHPLGLGLGRLPWGCGGLCGGLEEWVLRPLVLCFGNPVRGWLGPWGRGGVRACVRA